jgi:hypothetical protein
MVLLDRFALGYTLRPTTVTPLASWIWTCSFPLLELCGEHCSSSIFEAEKNKIGFCS